MAITLSGTASDIKTSLGLGTAADLNVGTSANNIVQLDGSGKLPAVDGSALTGLTGGKVLSMDSNVSDTQASSTSSSPVNDLSITVTPQSSSSKFLIILGDHNLVTPSGRTLYQRIDRNGTNITADARTECSGTWRKTTTLYHIDSPATTSAVTYTYQYYLQAGGTGYLSYGGGRRQLTVIEFTP